MKKNVLAMSIAALIGGLSLAGGASAAVFTNGADATDLAINKDGKGHILLVPYYNASENNTTVINLVNSDTLNGKALKVRFRGANNSDDVFDFTLFLSPGDVWSGAVVHNAGSAALFTNDNSCVLPDNAGINSGTPINFVTSRLGNAGAKGTLEGYVEVLNMADIPSTTSGTGSLYKAIKHVNGVAPCFGADEFAPIVTTLGKVDATLTEVTGTDPAVGQLAMTNPTSGLFANWTIINTTNVSSWGGDATAVVATGGTGKGNIVFFPQINDVVNDVIDTVTADPLMQGTTPKVTPRQYDLPDLSTPYVSASGTSAADQADTLTGALAVTAVQNEFITSSSVAGATDWVFSMPTRRYHVALDYAATGTTPAYRVFRTGSTYFTPTNTSVDSTAARIAQAGERSICVGLGSNSLDYRDRSERTPAPGGFVISPNQPAAGLSFCGEASVLSFNSATSNVLGATIGQNGVTLTSGFNSGWASINTSNGGLGYPILGAAFQKYLNVGAGGVQGNFGSVWPHRYNRP